MKKRLLPLFCGILATVFLLSPFVVSAEPQTAEPATEETVTQDNPFPVITCTAATVFNLEAETVLYEKNMDARLNPAAFTKLMTALLAYEHRVQNGNVTVTVTEEMLSSAGGTSMKLKVGEVISFDDLLSGLVVQNANDAALVLASVTGGNIAAFVESMNERAKKLGMEQTYYANPTGVDSAVMYTTMRDTLTLCRALYRVNDFMLLSETPKITIPATNLTAERVYTNKNALVPFSYVTDYYTEGVRGMVAGYTSGAGYCVATTRKQKNATFLVILSGGEDRSEAGNQTDISSYREATALLNWAEKAFSFQKLLPKGKVICEKKVRLGAGVDHMILVTGEEFTDLLPTDLISETEISYEIKVDGDVFTAPIVEGSQYGSLEIIYQGEILGTVPLVSQTNIGLSRWLVLWDAIRSFFSQGPAKTVLILAVSAVILYIVILIATVWLQYYRRTRAKRRAIAELDRQESQRLATVRLREKRASQARRARVQSALREGFRVLSGEADALDAPRRTAPPQRRAVAKVPQKYRSQSNPYQKRPANVQGARPVSRTGASPRPAQPQSKSPSRSASSAQRSPYQGREQYRINRNGPAGTSRPSQGKRKY